MVRSKEDLERWQAFAGFINKMIKDGHGEKVAVGLTGALMAHSNVDAMFGWAAIYFKDEIEAVLQTQLGPKTGETVH